MHIATFKKLEDMSAPIRRKYEYYEKCMIDKEFYKETRLLGVNSYFNNLYTAALKKLNKITLLTDM